MPRTGQPSTRDVEATVRAVEILDVLAEGGELGTTDVSRRTGISASTVSRQLGTLTRVGLVEHVAATGRYRLGVRTLRYANAVLGRLNLRDLARPHLEELVHQVGETATLSIPGRGRCDHRRLRPDRPLPPGRDAARAAERRPRVVGGQGDARLRRRAPAARASWRRSRRGRSPTRRRSRARSSRSAPRAMPRRSRSARPASARSPRRSGTPASALAAIVALQGPTSRFDAEAIAAAVPLLLTCAERTSVALGWHE